MSENETPKKIIKLAEKEIERAKALLNKHKKPFLGLIACKEEAENVYFERYLINIPDIYLTKNEAEKALFFMLLEKKIPLPKNMVDCTILNILTEKEAEKTARGVPIFTPQNG